MRRVFPVLCALVIFFSCTPLSVSAASYAIYDWMDLAEIYWTDNDTTPPQYALHADLPKQNWFMYVWKDGYVSDKAVYENGEVKINTRFEPGHYYRISFGFYNLWTHDIPPAWLTEIWYTLHFWGMNWNTDISTQPTIFWSTSYSDEQSFTGNDGFTDHYDFDPSTGDFWGRANPTLNNFGDWVIPGVIIKNFYVNKIVSCTIELTDLEFDLRCTQKFYNSWKDADLAKTQEKNQLLLQNQELLLNDMINEQETTNEKMDDVIGGTPEQNNQVNNAVNGMQDSTDKLDQMGDTLNSVEKPAVEDMNVGITDLVPETSLLAYTSPILALWENKTLLAFLIIVLTLVLVSWVMFGKKG